MDTAYRSTPAKRIVRRPANVTLRDFAYFLAVPSLVYEPRYPRTKRVRWDYVARKLGEAALCAAFQYAVMKQFMLPVLEQGAKSPHAAGLEPGGCGNGTLLRGFYFVASETVLSLSDSTFVASENRLPFIFK